MIYRSFIGNVHSATTTSLVYRDSVVNERAALGRGRTCSGLPVTRDNLDDPQ